MDLLKNDCWNCAHNEAIKKADSICKYCTARENKAPSGWEPIAPCEREMVNHPEHYNQGGVECIDALAAATANLRGIEAFCTANAIKYLWRWKSKNGVEDLKKANWYIDYLIEREAESD